MLAAVVVLTPRSALAKIVRPNERDDAAEIQAMIDGGQNPIVLENRVYTLRRPIILRGQNPITIRSNHITFAGRNALVIGDYTPPPTITHCTFVSNPSLLTRVLNRFAR